jgi:glycosyltransferase involved in cell wall biosynthesis
MRVIIAIPAYNEEAVIDTTIRAVTKFCGEQLRQHEWRIVVTDNRSTDQTAVIVRRWQAIDHRVLYVYVPTPGKGAALAAAWQHDSADVYSFMDADLATNLLALPLLIDGIQCGADVVVGSRALPQSRVQRSVARRLLSSGYRLASRLIVGTRCSDLPCGFKAINQRTKQTILPHIVNAKWFFDSELVLRAEHAGYRITEVPVDWAERRPKGNASRVAIFPVATAYLKELWRMRKTFN